MSDSPTEVPSQTMELNWVNLTLIIVVVSVCTLLCAMLGSYCIEKLTGGKKSAAKRSTCCRKCESSRRPRERNHHETVLMDNIHNEDLARRRNRFANGRVRYNRRSRTLDNGEFERTWRVQFEKNPYLRPLAADDVPGGATFDRLGIGGGDDRSDKNLLMSCAKQLENQQLSPIQQTPPQTQRLGQRRVLRDFSSSSLMHRSLSTNEEGSFRINNNNIRHYQGRLQRSISSPSYHSYEKSEDSRVFGSSRGPALTPSTTAAHHPAENTNSGVRIIRRERESGLIRSLTPENALVKSVNHSPSAQKAAKEPGTPGNTLPQLGLVVAAPKKLVNLNLGKEPELAVVHAVCERCGTEHDCCWDGEDSRGRRKRRRPHSHGSVRTVKRRSNSRPRRPTAEEATEVTTTTAEEERSQSPLCQGDECDVVGCLHQNTASDMFKMGHRGPTPFTRRESRLSQRKHVFDGLAKASPPKLDEENAALPPIPRGFEKPFNDVEHFV